jgi:MoaA/NifB/PqqE/SkfB family radical SAM enzyme
MSMDLFEHVVGQFPGAKRLHLQGLGEPLLAPRFFAMISLAMDKGLEVSTSSSLADFDDSMAHKFAESGLHVLHVSIDGARAATYEALRCGASFEKLLASIDLLLKAREEYRTSFPRIRMTVVVMRRNLSELSQLVALGSALGMDEVFVQHLCRTYGEESLPGRYAFMRAFVARESLLNESPDKIVCSFEEARQTARQAGIALRLPSLDGRRNRDRPVTGGCDWPWTGAYVNHQGIVMPCCMVSTPDRFSFGSLEKIPFSEIWEGEAYGTFRKRLLSPDPPGVCLHCSVYNRTF